MTSASRYSSLFNLFITLFSADELRRFARYNFEDDVSASLPGPQASLADLVEGLIQTLDARNLVNHQLFALLRAERKYRIANIAEVEALWTEPARPQRSPRPIQFAWISDTQRKEVYKAAIESRLATPANLDALLAGMDPDIVATLDTNSNPAARLLTTLSQLNGIRDPYDGTIPLARWLENAAVLTSGQPTAATFLRALEILRINEETARQSMPESFPSPDSAARRQEFRARLRARDVEPREPSPAIRAWLDAAAVLYDFDPWTLQPFGPAEGSALDALAPWIDERPDGRWVLQDRWRSRLLPTLPRDSVRLIQDANPEQIGRRAVCLRMLDQGEPIAYSRLGPEALADLEWALAWLGSTRVSPAFRDDVRNFIERRRIVEPLRRLTGAHFRARGQELAQLRTHLDSRASPDTCVLWGPGGVGKSALLGALLLAIEDAPGEYPAPFVYLDFDHAALDPLQPNSLLEAVARQLGLLYGSRRDILFTFIGLESYAAGDRLNFAAAAGSSLVEAAAVLAGALSQLPLREPPLLLVLDTFERVQVRGERVVASVRGFIDAIAEAWPRTRVLVSSRAPLAASWGEHIELHLTALPRDEAIAVLRALALDAGLAARIVEQLGTSPLTLRLAADAVGRAGRSAVEGVAAYDVLVGEARDALVQQTLYNRILGHLGDRELEALAHPGLVVRRITRDVLADVLAEPCGFTRERAVALFERLAAQITLLEPAGDGVLRHRPDVRALMLRAMLDDIGQREAVQQVHVAAERFYAGRTSSEERAELLYHRLWLGCPTEQLDALWTLDLQPLLASAWDEPLPAAARAWLGPRIGQPGDEPLDDQTWQLKAAQEAQAHLDTGDPAGALAIVRERSARHPDSYLVEIEADALQRLGHADEAEGLLVSRPGAHIQVQLRRFLLRVRIAETTGGLAALKESLERALLQARDLDDVAAELELRAAWLRSLRSAHDVTTAAEAELMVAFMRADAAALRRHPALSAEVLQLIGPLSAAALKHGALALARTFDERGVFRFDALAVAGLLHHLDKTPGLLSDMAALATRVGLARETTSPTELIGAAVRHGLLGDALALLLDHGGHDPDIRLQVVQLINPDPRPAGGPQ